MNEKKLSVVIPSYKDPLIHNTLDSLLENSQLGDQLEIIVVLDGYWPVKQIKNDPRIKIIHLGKNRGMKGAINAGMAIAKGEFVGRLDEHSMFCKGYDKFLTDSCKPNQIMTPRRYFLDPIKWAVMEEQGYVDSEKLVIQDCGNGVRKFSGQKWISRDKEFKDVPIFESFAMQGSFWIVPRALWEEAVGAFDSERFGPHQQDSHELTFKVWQKGGELVVNKDVWFAHKYRKFSRTHNNGSPENPANAQLSYKAMIDEYEQYYNDEIVPRMYPNKLK